MKIYKDNSTIVTMLMVLALAGCGPKTESHFNEFSGIKSNVINNNKIISGFSDSVFLDAASAGNYVVVMFRVSPGTDIASYKRRMKVYLVNAKGENKSITGISDSYTGGRNEQIEYASELFSYGPQFYMGYQYVMNKQDFLDIVNAKHVKFVLEGSKGSTIFEVDGSKLINLRDFANKYII